MGPPAQAWVLRLQFYDDFASTWMITIFVFAMLCALSLALSPKPPLAVVLFSICPRSWSSLASTPLTMSVLHGLPRLTDVRRAFDIAH